MKFYLFWALIGLVSSSGSSQKLSNFDRVLRVELRSDNEWLRYEVKNIGKTRTYLFATASQRFLVPLSRDDFDYLIRSYQGLPQSLERRSECDGRFVRLWVGVPLVEVATVCLGSKSKIAIKYREFIEALRVTRLKYQPLR